jgi:hypothetical protein
MPAQSGNSEADKRKKEEEEHEDDVEDTHTDDEDEDEELEKAIKEGEVGKEGKKDKIKGKEVKKDDDIIRAGVKEDIDQLNKTLGLKVIGTKKGSSADMQKVAASSGATAKKFNLTFTDDEPWEAELKDIKDHFSGMDDDTALKEYRRLANSGNADDEENEKEKKKSAKGKGKKDPKI